jgi:hypothetical protein
VQRKIEVGSASDPQEREADRVAEEVVRLPDSAQERRSSLGDERAGGAAAPLVRRELAGAASATSPGPRDAPPAVAGALGQPGRPLDRSARAFFEPRFGYDFSAVRVHTGARAAQSAKAVGAQAYTFGRNIVFGAHAAAPEAPEGRRLLAHELAHVVQQQGAPAEGAKLRRQSTPETSTTKSDAFDDSTLLHEGLHAYAHPTFAPKVLGFLDEGATQFFTRQIASDLRIESSSGYDNVRVPAVQALVGKIGEEALRKAYFQGDFSAADAILGACGLEEWGIDKQGGLDTEAEKVLQGPKSDHCGK